jgi:hypothetical protein
MRRLLPAAGRNYYAALVADRVLSQVYPADGAG